MKKANMKELSFEVPNTRKGIALGLTLLLVVLPVCAVLAGCGLGLLLAI